MAPLVDQSLEVLPYEYDEEVYLESNPDALVCEDHDVTDDTSTLAVNLPPPDEINYTPGPTEYVEVNETLASVENRKPVDATRSFSGLWNPVTRYTDPILTAALNAESSLDNPLDTPEQDHLLALLDQPQQDYLVVRAAQTLSSSPDYRLTPDQEASAVAMVVKAEKEAQRIASRRTTTAPVALVETSRDEGDEDHCPLCDHHQEPAVAPANGSGLATNSGGSSESADLSADVAEVIVENPATQVAIAPQPVEVPLQAGQPPVQTGAAAVVAEQQAANSATVSEAVVANNPASQRPSTSDVRVSSRDLRTARNNSGGPFTVAAPAIPRSGSGVPTVLAGEVPSGPSLAASAIANRGRTVQGSVVPAGGVVIASEATAPAIHPTDRRAENVDGTVVQGSESKVVLVSSNLPEFRRVERERGNRAPDLMDGTSAPITVAINPNLAHDQSASRNAAQSDNHNVAGGSGVASTVVLVARDGARQNDDGAVARTLREPLLSVRGQGTNTGSGLGGQSGNGGTTAQQVEDLLALSELEEPTEVDFELGEELDPSDFSPSQVYIG